MCSNQIQRHGIQAARKQGFRCWYCTFLMWENDPGASPSHANLPAGLLPRFRCTAEHCLPRSQGGSDAASNIVAACAFCNRTRHRRRNPPTSDAFRNHVARRVRQGRWHPPEAHQALMRSFSRP
jgi:hypothetical protein